MKHPSISTMFLGLLSALSMPAEAHPGHSIVHDFQAGLMHPFLGADHLLVMIGIGMWAAFIGATARYWLPAVFLTAMAAGASLAFSGFALPNPEIGVAGSVLATGLILATGWRFRLSWAALLAALFAASHGYVHALEAGADSQALYYAGGFIISTALLLSIGFLAGWASLVYGRWFKTAFGLISAAAGISLLLGF